MPKMKTKSAAKKRFKITGTGKVLYAQAGKRLDLIGVDLDHVVEERLPGGVDVGGDARLEAARHHVRRGRHRDLVRAVGVLLQERRFVARERPTLADLLADDAAGLLRHRPQRCPHRGVGGRVDPVRHAPVK